MPKLIAVVGGKHSGKTTTIENLTRELTSRKYRVGTIKEMLYIPSLDTPQKETDRYRQAGAQTVVALPQSETVIFVAKTLTIQEILLHLQDLDYVLLEGFVSERWLPKIVAAKNAREAKSYFDSSVVAVSGIITDSPSEMQQFAPAKLPVLSSLRDTKALADVVLEKALDQPV